MPMPQVLLEAGDSISDSEIDDLLGLGGVDDGLSEEEVAAPLTSSNLLLHTSSHSTPPLLPPPPHNLLLPLLHPDPGHHRHPLS